MPSPENKQQPRLWKWAAFACAIAAIIAAAAIFRDAFAELLGYAATVTETTADRDGATVKEISALSPGARFFRDFMIALAAILGMAIAGWRTYVLDRQSKTAAAAVKVESDRHINERFATATELMAKETKSGNPAIAARIGGIYIMEELANSNPARFLRQAVINLIAYIKDNAQLTAKPPLEKGLIPDAPRFLGEDVKAAFKVLGNLLDKHEEEIPDSDLEFLRQNFSGLDLTKPYVYDLYPYKLMAADMRGANLIYAVLRKKDLTQIDLRGANLRMADLEDTSLMKANLQGADLRNAALKDAHLEYADLRGAVLDEADLSGAKTAGARFLDDSLGIHDFNLKIYDAYALVGVLRNFAERGEYAVSRRAMFLRAQARKLLKDDRLPLGFPDEWRKWLEGVDPETGRHPDDSAGENGV